MKILVDMNHPAHVHYFKNFIWEMQKRGHEVLITASKKDVAYALLDHYGFDYMPMGTYGNHLMEKLINIPIMDLRLLRIARSFNPDIFLGFGSIRGAHASKLMKKPCINLDDTEHSFQEHLLYLPFTDVVLTPKCFLKDLGKKQIRYNGYTELAYLHPNYFTPNPRVLDEIGLSKGDTFSVLRFVSWTASHDVGQRGIRNKVELVRKLKRYGRVLITSEGILPTELNEYKIKISPEKMHDILYYASLYIGEGGTMASEAAILGTHAIHISTTAKHCGIFHDLRNYGLMLISEDENDIIHEAMNILQDKDSKSKGKRIREQLLKDKMDLTAFLVEFIENYPKSLCEMVNGKDVVNAK